MSGDNIISVHILHAVDKNASFFFYVPSLNPVEEVIIACSQTLSFFPLIVVPSSDKVNKSLALCRLILSKRKSCGLLFLCGGREGGREGGGE